MFAVIKAGGKQYKVSENTVVAIEKIDGKPGSTVAFSDVLIMGKTIGQPFVSSSIVTGEILRQFKGDKVVVFKKQRRKNYRRRKGHRQHLTLVKIIGAEYTTLSN